MCYNTGRSHDNKINKKGKTVIWGEVKQLCGEEVRLFLGVLEEDIPIDLRKRLVDGFFNYTGDLFDNCDSNTVRQVFRLRLEKSALIDFAKLTGLWQKHYDYFALRFQRGQLILADWPDWKIALERSMAGLMKPILLKPCQYCGELLDKDTGLCLCGWKVLAESDEFRKVFENTSRTGYCSQHGRWWEHDACPVCALRRIDEGVFL